MNARGGIRSSRPKRFISRPELVVLIVLAITVYAGPYLTAGGFLVTLMGYTFAFALFAMSVWVVLGWIGEIPLGHSLYYGLGAYGSGILMKEQGYSFLLAALLAALGVAVLATVVGIVTLRLTGAYFSIVSWGLASVAVTAANSADSLTGGALGLLGVPPATIGSFSLADPAQYAWVAGTILLITVAGLAVLRWSRFGQRVNGGRVNDHLVRACGANIYRDRVLAFAFSAMLAAVAGALSVSYLRVVTPGLLGVTTTVEALVMVLLGGTAFLLGPVLGAAFFRIVPEQFDLTPELRTIAVAAIILAIVMLFPGGVADLFRKLTRTTRRPKTPARTPGDASSEKVPAPPAMQDTDTTLNAEETRT
jgi:branched-chain amino acid transport system permease protein